MSAGLDSSVSEAYQPFTTDLMGGLIDSLGDALIGINAEQQIVLFNRGAEELFDYCAPDVLGRQLDILLPPDNRAAHEAHLETFAKEGVRTRRMGHRRSIRARRADGTEFPAGATISVADLDCGRIFFAAVRDITHHVETRNHLAESLNEHQRLARLDPLTDVLNGRVFKKAIEQSIKELRENGVPFTLVFIDADRFKEANDVHGHVFGDELLKTVAARLSSGFRSTDVVARVGGDEFGVLMPDCTAEIARTRIPKLRTALLADMQAMGASVTFSIGVLNCIQPPESVGACLHAVDSLMYSIKYSTGDGIAWGELDGVQQV